MIKAKDYNRNPKGTYYLSVINIDMEGKYVIEDILTSCTLVSEGNGYYIAKYKSNEGRDINYYTSCDGLFLTMDEAIKYHNKEINKALDGLQEFIEDLKRRIL